MSKAFTRETDEAAEAPSRQAPSWRMPGIKNYITPRGAKMLIQKLDHLLARPPSPATSTEIQDLRQTLHSVVVAQPPALPWEQVLFGALVTVRNKQNEICTYRLVGVEETELQPNGISWRSPMGRALLKAKRGERVGFQTPEGDEELEIIDVCYEL